MVSGDEEFRSRSISRFYFRQNRCISFNSDSLSMVVDEIAHRWSMASDQTFRPNHQ